MSAAYLLALLAVGPRTGALFGGLTLAALVVGYYATSNARGYAVGTASVLFWALAAFTAGPALGLGAQWLRSRSEPQVGWGVGVMAGVLVGEGATSLVTVADTTYPPYRVAEIVFGALLFGWLARGRLTSARSWVSALGAVAVVGTAFAVVYLQNPVTLI